MTRETISLSRAELKKALVMDKLIAGALTTAEAAQALGFSKRQVLRLKTRASESGPEALIHGNRGRQPAHTVPGSDRERIVHLYKETYAGTNYCHLAQLLAQREGIQVSPSTVSRILKQAGIAPARQRRRPKAHRPRKRKPQAGWLWQTDASTHAWLEERGPRLALHAFIDDATGTVVGAAFRSTEDLQGYLVALDKAIRRYGIPLALYSDRHTIFLSPKEPLSVEQELAGETPSLSQFGHVLADLHIEHIAAQTPQAKGRIERLWGTLQDRLVIELRLRHVCTLEQANAVLDELLEQHNGRFAVPAADSEPAHRPIPASPALQYLIAWRETRMVSAAQTVSVGGQAYRLDAPGRPAIPARTSVQVRRTLQGQQVVLYNEHVFTLTPVDPVIRPKSQTAEAPKVRKPHKPAANHYWRRDNPYGPRQPKPAQTTPR